jgi:hypothetical protein
MGLEEIIQEEKESPSFKHYQSPIRVNNVKIEVKEFSPLNNDQMGERLSTRANNYIPTQPTQN